MRHFMKMPTAMAAIPRTKPEITPHSMSVLDDLATALGLLQSPAKDAAKDWARRTREAMTNGSTPDQAATIAATKVFGAAEFQTVKYRGGSVEKLLEGIDAL
jgi:hypothetical protein